jgi:hypothetical protein
MKVRCGGCNRILQAPDRAAGKLVQCPNCGSKLRIPGEAAGGGPPAQPATPPPPEQRPPQEPPQPAAPPPSEPPQPEPAPPDRPQPTPPPAEPQQPPPAQQPPPPPSEPPQGPEQGPLPEEAWQGQSQPPAQDQPQTPPAVSDVEAGFGADPWGNVAAGGQAQTDRKPVAAGKDKSAGGQGVNMRWVVIGGFGVAIVILLIVAIFLVKDQLNPDKGPAATEPSKIVGTVPPGAIADTAEVKLVPANGPMRVLYAEMIRNIEPVRKHQAAEAVEEPDPDEMEALKAQTLAARTSLDAALGDIKDKIGRLPDSRIRSKLVGSDGTFAFENVEPGKYFIFYPRVEADRTSVWMARIDINGDGLDIPVVFGPEREWTQTQKAEWEMTERRDPIWPFQW